MSEDGREFLFDKISSLINYASKEFDLSYGEVIQVLEMQKLQLFNDSLKEEGEEEEDYA